MQEQGNTPAQAAQAKAGNDIDDAVAMLQEEGVHDGSSDETVDISDLEDELLGDDANDSDDGAEEGAGDDEEAGEDADDGDEENRDDEDGNDDADNEGDAGGRREEGKGERKGRRPSGYQKLKRNHQNAIERALQAESKIEEVAEENKGLQEAFLELRNAYEELHKHVAENEYADPNELRIRNLERELERARTAPERERAAADARAKRSDMIKLQAEAEVIRAEAEELCEEFGLKDPEALMLYAIAAAKELDEGQKVPTLRDVAARQARLRENSAKRVTAEKARKQAATNALAPKTTKPGRAPRVDYSKPTDDNIWAWAQRIEREGA